jgi:hypothetical protein
MIRPLRARHRALIRLLTVGLIGLFIAALIVGQPAPVTPNIPEALLKTEGGKR